MKPFGPDKRALADQDVGEARIDVTVEDRLLVVAVLRKTLDLLALDRLGALVLLDAVAVEHAHFDDGALNARGHAQRGVAHVGGLLAEDGAQQLLFRRHRAFALRRDLADENVARDHFGADVDDARLVEVLQRFFRDVGNVARDFLGSELGVARHRLEFLDVDRGEDVVLDDALGEQDRVLEVVAVPGHERDEHVAAEREIAEIGRGTVGDDVALLDAVADAHQRLLVDAGRLVGALELHQAIDVDRRLGGVGLVGRADDDTGRVDLVDHARAARGDRRARVARHDRLHAGADQRRVGANERHRLALHVRAHQRAVGVVVLEERDQRRGDGNELLGRDVHVVDALAGQEHDVAGLTADDEIADEMAVLVDRRVRLRDRVFLLLHRGEIEDLFGHLAVANPAVGRLDEAVFVDAREGGERVDQADVRAFRRLDRADAAVVGRDARRAPRSPRARA